MRIHKVAAAAIALGTVLAVGQVSAQEAQTLEDLLKDVQQGGAVDRTEQQQRLRDFRQRQAEQTQLLEQAKKDRDAELARSERLETQFEENERLIVDVQAQLDERLGSLKELFGVVQQVAGDARSQFQNSLTSIEFPDRTKFLTDLVAKMSSSTRLATIDEIQRLWFELQREATEQGTIKRLRDFPVITADGVTQNEDIVRVGTFNVVADGRYLQRNPETNSVSELPRQPSESRFIKSTTALVNSKPDGPILRFGIDVTSGQLLSLLIDTPDFKEYVQQGRQIGYVTIALGIIGILLSIERLITLSIVSGKVRRQLKSDTPSSKNPLGRVLMVYQDNPSADPETLELKLGEAILKETPALQRGILFIKIISVVAPLLGLLGTVTGMIVTFQQITLFGTSDPTVMASGISQALMTTVIGLCVAIPTVLMHTIVNGRSRSVMQVLQEQSAGIVAQQAEKTQ